MNEQGAHPGGWWSNIDKWLGKRLVILVLLALPLLAHLPATRAQFSGDDGGFISRNAVIHSLANLPRLFTSAFPPDDPARGLYRPLTAATYALDYALWGASGPAFHTSQWALSFFTGLLVYAVGLFYLQRRWAALLLSWVFSLHPVHCEVVDSVSGRSELLGLTLCLLSLWLFQRGQILPARRWGWWGLSWAAYVAATLAKETSVVFPAVLLLHCLIFPTEPTTTLTQRLRRSLPAGVWFLWVPLYMALRVAVLGRFRPDEVVMGEDTTLTRVYTIFAIIREYSRLLIWPDILQIDPYYKVAVGIHTAVDGAVITGMLITLGWATALIFLVFQEARHPGFPLRSSVLFGLASFLVFFFPTSHVIPFGALMAERFLFSPSFGFLLAVVAGVTQLQQGRKSVHPILLLILLCLPVMAGRTWARAEEWQDMNTLHQALVDEDPNNGWAWMGMAEGAFQVGDIPRAREYASRAAALEPWARRPRVIMAKCLVKENKLEEAEVILWQLLAESPRDDSVWNTLGTIETQRTRLHMALGYFANALTFSPNYTAALKNYRSLRTNMDQAVIYRASWCQTLGPETPLDTLHSCKKACRVLGDQSCEGTAQALMQSLGIAPVQP